MPDMEARRGPKDPWGVELGERLRIQNLTDGSEKPAGEWNRMAIECKGRSIDVWVSGDRVSSGRNCTADHGRIALRAEGSVVELRRLELTPL